MADGVERETKFRDAALELADDATRTACEMLKQIRKRDYEKAHSLAGSLQRAARDAKWLVRRLPKRD